MDSRTHRRLQLALRAATLRDLLRLWPIVDLERLPQTWPPFERAATLLIRQRGRTSAGLASRYYRDARRDAGIAGSPPAMRGTPAAQEIEAGLKVVGVVESSRALALARPLALVEEATLTKVAGATAMYVLDHGRDVLLHAVQDDEKALGWARETSGSPCAFCAMLASRGPVYGSEASARFEAHRSCACFPTPQFDREQPWPAGAQEYGRIWSESTRGLSGQEARLAFRRAYEGR